MPKYVVPRPAGARDDEEPYLISVTRNCDCVFTIRCIDPITKQPTDWDSDVWVFVDVGYGTDQEKVVAAIVGPDAVVRIESGIADEIQNGGAWQAVRSLDGQPSLEPALLVGAFVRSDGGRISA
ncbi:hypothetical protein [Mycolicibacter arupensis]|jgi:hypothetical protein|uniref:Uncharacterized protein n=1 Tax=Mycolicibacter arupensis TaxID=342002 RepID=A0A0F5MVW6_9MYCO|nr:hypothetical protein [Mycolicibacter arupensis]KKB98831.1 hypothetical protein WR43_12535 [Mycolicibacter arupensis]MCV7277103.1 hypothetical protein [Mycolicibacter arupensis]OQZ93669.1 hypothetical protein BST15_17505 [Mycolicibacter arupensis]TXI54431.1 MAG: hypothetical protein E6Q54_14605 [Mycolicibacter arupensis]